MLEHGQTPKHMQASRIARFQMLSMRHGRSNMMKLVARAQASAHMLIMHRMALTESSDTHRFMYCSRGQLVPSDQIESNIILI
jgi:hypothetical protein